jgi:hypothetical protein
MSRQRRGKAVAGYTEQRNAAPSRRSGHGPFEKRRGAAVCVAGVVAVMRRPPNLAAVEAAARRLPSARRRIELTFQVQGAEPVLSYTRPAMGEKRYAYHEGKAYCGKEHQPGRWHGWPVGWVEVPEKLRTQWVKGGKVKRQDIERYWDGGNA